MKKIEAKANITAIANREGRKIAISELPSIYKKDGQKVICEDGAIRSDDACFYPEGKKSQSNEGSESKQKAEKKGRKAAAPKTKVQELECIIDNLCTFAAEVEGEAHEAESFRNIVTEAGFFVNLRQSAEAIDKAAAEAAEAEAARLATIEEQKKTIEGLAKLPHLIPEYVSGIINNGTFVYDACFDEYLTEEQLAKYKPAEADNEPAAEGDNSDNSDNSDNEPAEAAEGAKVEATDKATTAKGKGRKTA